MTLDSEMFKITPPVVGMRIWGLNLYHMAHVSVVTPADRRLLGDEHECGTCTRAVRTDLRSLCAPATAGPALVLPTF